MDFSSCVILAGITNYRECENKKIFSRKINCENIIKISKEILKKYFFMLCVY